MRDSENGQKYSFVTIVYEEEYELLLLQARSLRLYCCNEIVESVIVIDNSSRSLPSKWRSRFAFEYGHLADRLQIIDARDVAKIPPTKGWKSQQILKLMIANRVSTERYVVLDAKNHLVSRLAIGHLQADDGRPRTHTINYEKNPLRRHLERTLAYFRIPLRHHILRFAASTTPFIMCTDIVRSLTFSIATNEGVRFEAAFLKFRLTEFFSYSCYIIKTCNDIEAVYDLHQKACPCIWDHNANAAGCRSMIKSVIASDSPFFAVHKNSIGKLDPEARRAIAEFWASRKLFETANEADEFLVKLGKKLSVYKFIRPLTNLPAGVAKHALKIYWLFNRNGARSNPRRPIRKL